MNAYWFFNWLFSLFFFSGELKVLQRKREPLLAELTQLKFAKIADSFDYLLSVPLWNLTEERIQKLAADRQKKDDGMRMHVFVIVLVFVSTQAHKHTNTFNRTQAHKHTHSFFETEQSFE